ncbi:Resolvase, N-terminal domain [Magnetococcus marinus MC-1]|uniref:Resolvase, N-terminal domain n=1 Tax=Magnetococcus marinus (strain ATCC BAA-1437 / JCM 17883 / MC-1) TaxID=156889 RepID=A0LBS4_MAGMM|nr:recombinase family protein [Magnetococcus marinus]ABK45417.1 Resolvase, N-terminal domain [Magnetococcus marinus MC-1]
MTAKHQKIRCAIYTRKSTEEGLDKDFNTMENQRESCSSYITSQKAEGWIELADAYDDPGFSGGTMKRPALTRLLQDIENGKVDCVCVYKIDRLSRSLVDFTKMIDLFDKHGVTFISITQSFNTTTSMGRLTLNILLSFAQFEREIAAERIQDKFAASRRKGMWMGGHPILGYDIQNRALVINQQEADQVRFIFQRYSECGSPTITLKGMADKGITNKTWTNGSGKLRIGTPFNKSTLNRLLKNRVYIGEVVHKGNIYPGLHEAIISQELWDKVEQTIKLNNRPNSIIPKGQTPFPLRGLVHCKHCGMAMTPTQTKKNGQVQYRYYSCSGARKGVTENCPLPNVPAGDIERLVLAQVQNLVNSPEVLAKTIFLVKAQEPAIPEHEIIGLLASISPVWDELFPLEQNRLLKLLVKSIDLSEQGADLFLNVEGIHTLVHELEAA